MNTSALKVLAVDDEPHILKLCRLNLGFEGMLVLEATDAAEAVEIAIREQPDVIVLDRMLPHMDGLTALRALKADAATSGIPVIMLTARALPGDRIDCWIAGASAHLAKPFSMDELTTTVKRFGAMSEAELAAHRQDLLGRLRELA
jgi:DNA-binding response OmpR family regulator